MKLFCRYLTPCRTRPSPMPSCTCLGRRAVTPSPHPAARGPWRSSTPCSQQSNVSATTQGQRGPRGTSRPPPSCPGCSPPASLCALLPFMSLRTLYRPLYPPGFRGWVTSTGQEAGVLRMKGRATLPRILFPSPLWADSWAPFPPAARSDLSSGVAYSARLLLAAPLEPVSLPFLGL